MEVREASKDGYLAGVDQSRALFSDFLKKLSERDDESLEDTYMHASNILANIAITRKVDAEWFAFLMGCAQIGIASLAEEAGVFK